MATSINEDVTVGNTKFHVQTEFYRSSGKIVSNIFKGGVALKRLEKEIESEESVEEEVKKFHSEVVDKLLSIKKKPKESSNKKISISEKEIEKILELISPFFGVASALIIEEALKSSSSKEELVQELLGELTGKERENLQVKLEEFLKIEQRTDTTFNVVNDSKDEILKILNNYYGIMALSVFEEALEKTKDKSFSDFVEEVASQLDEKEAKELKEKLNSLYT